MSLIAWTVCPPIPTSTWWTRKKPPGDRDRDLAHDVTLGPPPADQCAEALDFWAGRTSAVGVVGAAGFGDCPSCRSVAIVLHGSALAVRALGTGFPLTNKTPLAWHVPDSFWHRRCAGRALAARSGGWLPGTPSLARSRRRPGSRDAALPVSPG